MKHRIILLILIPFSLMSCNNDYKNILNDFGLHSYYLMINIEFDKQVIPIFIENSELYSLINGDSLNKKSYVKFFNNLLNNGESFIITSEVLFNKLRKYEVNTKGYLIQQHVNKDGKTLIKTFLNENRVMQEKASNEEKKTIIYMLFENEIFVKVDDESGYLYIP